MVLAGSAIAFCVFATMFHLACIVTAAIRCRIRKPVASLSSDPVPVTVICPVCGIDSFAVETLGSTFQLDYPRYEIIFCLARDDDPVAPIVRRLIAANPHVPARLLIGDDRSSANPKLNNVVKGWDAAQHCWIVLADSNVLMPPDYIQRLQERWRPDTGLVCSPPIGARPGNFWAELECAFLNTYQARYQYVGETLGSGFAQGKTMLFRRDVIEQGGGIRALGAELAEDAATTKLIRAAGLHVHLVDNPFEQPLGPRTAGDVWARQLRWARLRRVTFPLFFLPEAVIGSAFPIIAAAYAADHLGFSGPGVAGLLALVWFGAEAALARRLGWHWSWRMPLALVVRDLLLPGLWIEAWLGDSFVWRGTDMSVREDASAVAAAPKP